MQCFKKGIIHIAHDVIFQFFFLLFLPCLSLFDNILINSSPSLSCLLHIISSLLSTLLFSSFISPSLSLLICFLSLSPSPFRCNCPFLPTLPPITKQSPTPPHFSPSLYSPSHLLSAPVHSYDSIASPSLSCLLHIISSLLSTLLFSSFISPSLSLLICFLSLSPSPFRCNCPFLPTLPPITKQSPTPPHFSPSLYSPSHLLSAPVHSSDSIASPSLSTTPLLSLTSFSFSHQALLYLPLSYLTSRNFT